MSKITREEHSVNGHKYGEWLYFDDGRVAYMAIREGRGSKGFFVLTNSWCIDVSTINTAKRRGVKAILIAHRDGKKLDFYATNIEDLDGPNSDVHPSGTTRQRCLPKQCWLRNPMKTLGYITAKVKIR